MNEKIIEPENIGIRELLTDPEMPTKEEIAENLKRSARHFDEIHKEVIKRNNDRPKRVIEDPETMENALNMSDEDFYEYLKQENA